MTIEELNAKLVEAYSDKNLNKITLTLLNLYKEGQFAALNKIAEIIGDFVTIEIASDGKGFSKLMMLYHPDRGDFHRNTIASLTSENDYDGLLGYSHILKLMHIEEVAASIESLEDIDYSPVYEWDFHEDGFNIVNENQKKRTVKSRPSRRKSYSFYEAIKIRNYGHTKIEIPSYYFEDLDEIELSGSAIDTLEGIEFCKHAVVVDLSENQISDLTELWGLSLIEELDLSYNCIEIIDSLSNLSRLRQLNLSNNQITDITPLLELGCLEFVDLTGNRVNPFQIEEMIGLGINVVID
jgi:hypothetical protein